MHRPLVEIGGLAFEFLDAILQTDDVRAKVGGELDVVDIAQHRDAQLARDLADEAHHLARELRVPVLCNIHDVKLATEFCTRIIGLQDGIKKFEGTPTDLDERAMHDIYAFEVL